VPRHAAPDGEADQRGPRRQAGVAPGQRIHDDPLGPA
jgi:hypothetical protein